MTERGNKKYDNVTPMQYERRRDLMNPTVFLTELQKNIVPVAKDAYEP